MHGGVRDEDEIENMGMRGDEGGGWERERCEGQDLRYIGRNVTSPR